MKMVFMLLLLVGLLVGCSESEQTNQTATVQGIVKHISIYRDTINTEGVCITFEDGKFYRLRAKSNQELPFVIKRHQMITYNKGDLMIVEIH